ncbi:PREDICTED: amyloid beta A4 precursor protein-binding family A member 2-like [Rhinopithecus bieti]|uniref:amyloid beta A4 precursor protein-binding family A member 2-like n=1 Tax=Rhinopithecus bieti TaxID=61621 RepID=UPI00083BB09F|nr:PREDICTED: amyloid beta A4 precursor protein-binding family A member 2-like [Rhinopithecus bieti]
MPRAAARVGRPASSPRRLPLLTCHFVSVLTSPQLEKETLKGAQWLPPGNDGRGSACHAPPEVSTMAHRKRESAGSGVLDHGARPGSVSHGRDPESKDVELPLEGYVPEGLELAALCAQGGRRPHARAGMLHNPETAEWSGTPVPSLRQCDDSYLRGPIGSRITVWEMYRRGPRGLAHRKTEIVTTKREACQDAGGVDEAGAGSPHPMKSLAKGD